jgi:hypothetical protein
LRALHIAEGDSQTEAGVMPDTMFGLMRQICVHSKYNNEKVTVNFTRATVVKQCDLWYVNFGFG